MTAKIASLPAPFFSKYDSLASSPFTTRLTAGAIPESPSTHYSNYGFIDTLALAQRLRVQFLPITWQAALGPLDGGGQAAVYQALVNAQTSLAFKCFRTHPQTNASDFQELINEIIILTHPLMRQHPHIVRLEGICWDIPHDAPISPVLVFEKAQIGDLNNFVTSTKGEDLSAEDRLNMCVDIGTAVRDMHSNGTLHGDLKPKNVLVFKDERESYVARVADFGYSTRFCGDHDLVKVPKSFPWNAPEWHHRNFVVSKAKRMDIYSFGVLCLWLFFERHSFLFSHGNRHHSDRHLCFKDVLESRARDDSFLGLAVDLLREDDYFDRKTKHRLETFFACTLASDPDKRSDDFDYLLHLLVPERKLPQSEAIDLEPPLEYEIFQIESSFSELYEADFRVRFYIAKELQSIASTPIHAHGHIHPRDAALQVALCYQLGIGFATDTEMAKSYLDKYEIPNSELDNRVLMIREGNFQNDVQDGVSSNLIIEGYINQVSLAQHYHQENQLGTAIAVRQREIDPLEASFGTTHPFILRMKSQLACMLRENGCLKDAEVLDLHVIEISKTVLGQGHELTLNSMSHLASNYQDQGRWEEAESLKIEVLASLRSRPNQNNLQRLTALANLASTYRNQGQWEMAEQLEIEVLEKRTRVLGQDNVNTLSSMANLANTIGKKGKWTEAEHLERQVVSGGVKLLGSNHPLTMIWTSNLASTYHSLGRLEEALALKARVTENMKNILGQDHHYTLSSMAEIASLFRDTGRWQEAEDLLLFVLEGKRRILGPDHPSVLISVSNLASVYQNQGKLKEAEELELQVIERSSRILGNDHPDTLASEGNLASIYRKQRRWKEAETLERRVLEASIKHFGGDHPDSLLSMANLGTILYSQGQYAEAEELLAKVVHSRNHLLGPNHPSTLSATGNLALAFQGQGNWKEAEELEVQVLQARKQCLGGDHPDTLTSMHNLAMTLKAQSRSDEAIELMSDCVKGKEGKFGPESCLTKYSEEMLQEWRKERETQSL